MHSESTRWDDNHFFRLKMPSKNKPLTDAELEVYEAGRDLAADIANKDVNTLAELQKLCLPLQR